MLIKRKDKNIDNINIGDKYRKKLSMGEAYWPLWVVEAKIMVGQITHVQMRRVDDPTSIHTVSTKILSDEDFWQRECQKEIGNHKLL